jgi:hypothetical protein
MARHWIFYFLLINLCTALFLPVPSNNRHSSWLEQFNNFHHSQLSRLEATISFPYTSFNPGMFEEIESSSRVENQFPWKSSIVPSKELSYMRFFNHQLSILKKLNYKEISLESHMATKDSAVKPARIGNLCFEGGKFRKIRMTYFDGGENVQVS